MGSRLILSRCDSSESEGQRGSAEKFEKTAAARLRQSERQGTGDGRTVMIKAIWLSTVVSMAAMTIGVGASADAATVKAQQVNFVKQYLSAMQSKDRTAAMNLLHPALRACVTTRTR